MKAVGTGVGALIGVAMLMTGCANMQSNTADDQTAQAKGAQPAAAVSGSASTQGRISYNVVRGDHLWGIASRPTIYGNPYEWPLIFKANRDKIKDPDLIEPGQVFSIDKNPSKADINAAIMHAKTRGEWRVGAVEKSDSDYLAHYGMHALSAKNN